MRFQYTVSTGKYNSKKHITNERHEYVAKAQIMKVLMLHPLHKFVRHVCKRRANTFQRKRLTEVWALVSFQISM